MLYTSYIELAKTAIESFNEDDVRVCTRCGCWADYDPYKKELFCPSCGKVFG